jgi:hypothetical protein
MATSTNIVFPNIINVVLNDSLSNFMTLTTVSPAAATGTFTFRKTNSSGTQLQPTSQYDAVGPYTIYCSFTATGSYASSNATITLSVQDKDLFNNYFNIPVTDSSNVLVNGNFDYIPSSIGTNTSAVFESGATSGTVPGWYFSKYYIVGGTTSQWGNWNANTSTIYNNVDLGLGGGANGFRYPFGNVCLELFTSLYQYFYCVAGTYTLKLYVATPTTHGVGFIINIDKTRILIVNGTSTFGTGALQVGVWQQVSVTFTIPTTGMHSILLQYTGGGGVFYIGNVSITPAATNPIYLRFSKINSLIANGTFETPVASTNSKSITSITNWTVTGNAWTLNNYSTDLKIPIPYPSGNQCIALETTAKISQTFTATASTSNFLSFYACSSLNDGSMNSLKVTINNSTLICDISNFAFRSGGWTKLIYSGITTISGENILAIQGGSTIAGYISAIDNVIFGQVTKETVNVQFGPVTNYQYLPLQNETMTSNTYTAIGNGSLNGTYQCTASTNGVFTNSDIYYLFDRNPSTFYHSAFNGGGIYFSEPYLQNGTYCGANNASGILTNFWTTNVVNVGTVSGEWVQIKLPSPIKLTGYSLAARQNLPNRFPANYYVLGSNDGTTWYSIKSITNSQLTNAQVPAWPNSQYVDVSNNTQTYMFYRLVCTKLVSDGRILNFSKFYLFGDNSKNYYGTPLGANLNAYSSVVSGTSLYYLDQGYTDRVYPNTLLPVGNYTLYTVFNPSDTVDYLTSYGSTTLSVVPAETDVFNSYFNIPVTDRNNVLVNGDFNYFPSTIATNSSAIYESGATSGTVPGWYFSNYYLNGGNGTTGYSGGPYSSIIYNNVNLGGAIAFPYPFGNVCLQLKTSVYQFFYCVAGTYTLKLYVAIPTMQSSSSAGVYIDKNTILLINFVTSGPHVGTGMLQAGWQQVVTTFTVVTTGMHSLLLQYTAGQTFYIGNVSITPAATNPIYLQVSKINSLIANGTFDTPVASTNSKTNLAITNWTTVSGTAWTLNNYSTDLKIPIPYPSGNQCIALESTAKISRTFTSTASTSNVLSFYVCGGLNDGSMNSLKVTINNSTLICDISNFGFRTGGWSKQIYSGITTISGENILSFEGGSQIAGYITAIDNVIFGQVTKEARPITFVSPTNYQFLPFRNETMTSNTYNATQPGSLNGTYECTASSNRTVSDYDIYQLFTNDPTKIYISSDTYGGTPLYYTLPYPGDGTYIGATDSNGIVAYFFKTSVENVGTISGEWVQIKLPSPIRLTRYGLMGRNGYPERFPLNYYILGSNDGSTWYSIKSVTNSPIPTWPNIQYVDVPENTQAYSFYRLVCTKLGTNGLVLNFSKFYLFGDNSKTYYGTPLGSRLTASTDISGTFTYYTDPAYNDRIYPDSTLPASNYTLYSVFTPTDTIDYIPSYANTSLSIIASNPQIVFPKMINVVLNDTLADFISRVTIAPVVAGTFIFQKNNSSGATIGASNVYDAVGTYTIFCTFVPTNQVTYNTSSSTITLSVLDKDLFNNYFNVPVTDGSNILVNGNFDYIPSSIADNSVVGYLSGTSAGSLPGWYSTNWGSPTQYWPGYNIGIYNNINLGAGIAFPYPFGTKCIGLTGWLWQYFYCVAGTYTLKFYAAVKTLMHPGTVAPDVGGYAGINIDNTRVMNLNQSKTVSSLGSDQIPVAWKQISTTFTIATTGMHSLWMAWTGGGTGFYLGNISITPNNNFTYLKPSKINSLIANGMFETEVKTANSKSLTPITNWTVSGNAWVLNNYSTDLKIPIPYPSRNQCVAIESTAKISQTFTSTASSSNFLSFYVCGSTDDGSMNNIKVTVNSTVICDISFNSFRTGGWTKQIFSGITTISGENILTIEGGAPLSTGYISAIDNVVFGQVTKEARPITFTPQTNKGGTPLAANLTATTDISGTFAYYRDALYNIPVTAATTLAVGNYTLYTVFTPADTVDYNVAYANTSLQVIVQVIFPNVFNVVFGDKLEGFMNATTVSSGVPGTFTFRKNNSSGAVLTVNNTYDAVGTYTIYCSFVPTNTVAYNSCNATIILNVQDKDSFNNYFNIPVTDPNNVLVNGDFNYIPSSIGEGTMVSAPTNVPGWTFYKYSIYDIHLVNYMDVSAGITFPPPFATKTKKVIYFTGGYLFQWFYANAGTYQFSAYYAAPGVSTNYIYIGVDSLSTSTLRSSVPYPNLQNWQLYTTTITISTTGMHRFMMTTNGNSKFYAANLSLTPISNPIYLRFSKISSQIFNGAFETDVQTTNSMTLASLTNWTTVTGNIWVLNNYTPYLSTLPYPYPSGNQCIVVGGLGKITQTFTHVASSVNYLSFYMCSINDLSSNGIRVTLNSTTILEISSNNLATSASSLNSGSWQKMLFSGITTISGENVLTIEGLKDGNFLTAIDNVIFGQVTKESRPITFVSPTNYQFLPLRNETMSSNTYNATQPGSLIGRYECTASSNRTAALVDIYHLFDTSPISFYHGSSVGAGTPVYNSVPYASNGNYNGATDSNNNLAYFFKTNVVNVGTISGEWVQIKLPSPIQLTRYGLLGIETFPSRFPKDYYILGSNDGSTWYSINSVTNSQVPTWPNTQYVDVANTQMYMYYRLVCTKLGTNGGMINLSQFYLFGDNSKTEYGSPLGSRLTATTDISGTFAYYLDAAYTNQVYGDSTLPYDNYTLYTVFSPTDTIDYLPSYANTPLTLITPNPKIVFPNVINVVLNDKLADFMSRVTVSPANVPGSFTFRNASGSIITSESVYNTVGPYTISCTFVPNVIDTKFYVVWHSNGSYNAQSFTTLAEATTSYNSIATSLSRALFNPSQNVVQSWYFNESWRQGILTHYLSVVGYFASSSSYTVYVADKDVFNHYFNIPVTDPNNILVNGNFDYIPSSIAEGTSSTNLTNVPGWNVTFNTATRLYNNVDLSNNGVVQSLPYPFGTKCIRLRSAIYQSFYCVAGSYTFSAYLGAPISTVIDDYIQVNIDTTRIRATSANQGWQVITANFTVATTGMHYLFLNYSGPSVFYMGNISIKPVNNFTYLKPSKINSLILNGVFETETKTANSRTITPITNWTVLTTDNVWVLNNFSSYTAIPQPYPSGNQCISIESLGKIRQTFTTTASSSNFLSFYACAHSETSINTLRFSINSTVIGDMNTNMFRWGTWTKVIYSGITTISGENILTIEGLTAGSISAIDNVVFGQVVKEARPITFVSPTDYQFLPLQNETMTSNTYNATQPGSLIGRYECTASSNAVFPNSDIYYLFDTNPSTNYSTSFDGDGIYNSWPYANNGLYSGANNAAGALAYFFKTSVVNVGTVSGEWIQVKLPSPIRLTRYGIAPREQNGHRFPLDYYILGSNDGTTWYSIKSVTNSQIPTWPNTQYVDVPENTQMYMFYRLVCTRVSRYGADYNMLNFSQFALFGDNSKTNYGTPLGSTLNATTDISGSYAYYLDASYLDRVYPDSTLPAGNYNLYTVFNPSDSVDYLTSYGNRSFTVVLPNPQIVFPKIINVLLNETLSYFMTTTTVSPAIAGTFTFRKTNSYGSVLDLNSEYDVVGDYVIYCVFVPTDTANYNTIASTFELHVQDKEAYNNYYNIPVTDLSNILVNGNFNYFPSSYSGTMTTNATNITGWSVGTNQFFNDYNFSSVGASYPAPFGSIVIRVIQASIYQYFYAIAGTYTASLTYTNTYARPGDYIRFFINNVNAGTLTLGTTATTGQVTNWTNFSVDFTLATSGMHELQIFSTSNSTYFGNIKIVPTSVATNISFLKFSKIESQVFNGTFESEIRTANSRIRDAPLSNWNIATTGVWLLNNFTSYTNVPIPYPSGNQCVGIEGQGKITQTFNYIDSSFNYLSFYLTSTSDNSRNPIVVKMNNTVIYNPSSLMFRSQTWSKQIITNVTTVQGQNILSIEGTDTNKITMIDNVVFGSIARTPSITTYTLPANTTIQYGTPLAQLLTATCNAAATITYFTDSAYTNQVYADSTLPVGSYQMYVKSTRIDIYNFDSDSTAGPQNFSVIMPNPQIIFPNIINVVLNETLADFMSRVTLSPANVPGTFTFRNASGSIITSDTSYNAVGPYTISCTFVPTDTVTYSTSSSTHTVYVQDKDSFNHYFNVPVTDPTNLIVNGNFDYIPSSIGVGTSSTSLTNIPGWSLDFNALTILYNNVDLSNNGVVQSLPYPFGTKCLRINSFVFQYFYCIAGTYTFSCHVAIPVVTLVSSGHWVSVLIDGVQIAGINNPTQLVLGWQQFSVNFTIATTGMHYLRLYNNNASAFYFQNISIKPVTNPIATYVRFSKINSLISNGVFETEIKTANSRSLTPITNWTVVDNNVWVLNNFSSYTAIPQPYPSGNQCIAIESLGKVRQTFTATASSTNVLSFYACAISTTALNTLRFSINSTVIADMNSNMFRSGTWTKVIYTGITTVNGENILTIEGRTTAAGSITAIDNVIFGQVTKEARPLSFVSPTNYPFLPLRNETITSNTYNATQPGSLIGRYECTASSNAQNATDDIYYLFDTNPSTFYHGAYGGAGTPFYQSMPYAIDGTYIGAAITSGGSLGYFWTTNIVNVGTVSGEWIQVKLPSPIRLTRYGLAGRINWNARIPLDYYLLGSNNGSTWYSINRVTNSQLPTWPNTQYVDVPENTQMYMFYRIVCTKLGIKGRMINLSQFALFGDNSKTYYGTPLGSSLNAITDISGSYAYYLDPLYNNRVYPETTLPVGNHTLYTVFSPYDTVDYLTSSTNRSLTVEMPNPQIIFPKIINVVLNETLNYFMATTTVSPAVAGTFTFRKNNSSGSVLTEASVYDAVGDYFIYCTFVPTDTATYSTAVSTFEVSVQDKDAYNNYYNIPVTDLTNILINGNFTYFPSNYLYGTEIMNPMNVPGWRFDTTSYLRNGLAIAGTTSPPFGNVVVRMQTANARLRQSFFCVAGTYTFSLMYSNTASTPTVSFSVQFDFVTAVSITLGTLNDWQLLTGTVTLTHGMHEITIHSSSSANGVYFGNIKLVPTSVVNNISFMKFSKIESQVFNGSFESEIRTANSLILDAPLANWSIATSGVWLLNNYALYTRIPIPYPSGNQCIGIAGLGKITQTFNYIDSSLNYLSFYMAAQSDASRNRIIVKMNNNTIFSYVASAYAFYNDAWTKTIITNIATVAGLNTLSIEGRDINTMTMIDNVVFGSVTRSPAPTTYTLPANTILKYGLPLASLMTATSTIQTTFTYFIDSAYTNQVYPDSTLPIGNYQMYVVSTPFDTYNYLNSFASPQSFSVVSPNPTIVFPKMINVVFDETLANFINYTTVSPAIAGTFVFKLNNSSGAQLTETSKYNVIGKFTIFCTFTPANTVTYETTSATYSVTVEDNDAPNNYFNIPVTDTTNLLVNGNFEYIPSTYPPRTWTSNQPSATASNIPGWRFSTTHTSSYSAFINDLSISEVTPVISYPFPYGPKCAQLRGGQINQMVYLNAGTYTFSAYFAVSPKQDINSYVRFWIDRVNFGNINGYNKTTGNWEYYSINFIAYASKMYQFQLASAGGPSWFIQKMSIVPTYPNPIYLKFSKIESQIFNGSFETEIKTANSKSTVPLTNWSTERSPVWVLNSFTSYAAIPLPYPSGNQCVAIETVGKISQTFTYTASNVNYLSFYICGDASSNPITFKLNDISICTITSFSPFGGTWQKHIYTNLTTKEGINTLTIEGTNSTTGLVGIDNVILGRVNRATPTVTFPSPSPIVYGTDLSFVLVASCGTPGKFKYYIDVNYSTQVYKDTKLTPKMYSIYAIYTPTDQDNYAPVFATVDLSVNKAIPSLQYATPAPIQYGTLLESSLTATTNILGKIDYFSNPGLTTQVNSLTVLNPGTYTIYAKLTPTDLVGYTPLTTYATLVVNSTASFTPTMTYPTPTSITYGTNLANKLNASILPNIPGSIRYYTDATFSTEVTTYTVLLPGLYTIYARFIPTNATQSSQVSKSVSLFVSNLSIETRRLVLNTRDISSSTLADNYFNTTVTTSAGTVENNRYTHTWNTNIRSIMGDEFYNRYSKFSIQLKEFVNDGLFTTTQDASQNLSLYWEVYNECKLSGIQFDPLPYENGATSNVATMGIITRKYPASNPCYHNIVNGNGSTYTFSKTTDTVPVKIDLPNLYDDDYFAPATNAILFGHMTFVFEIRGLLI